LPKITFLNADGQVRTLDAETGVSLMQTAVLNGIDGIVGECGGSAMCATCHVYVDESFADHLTPPTSIENEMLDCAASERRQNSRLACQIIVGPEIDGLVVTLPEHQQ
jgi:ferredoxin, 2Fe-2S